MERIKHNPNYMLKHVSIRVPWHDNMWNGTVCQNPHENSSCLVCKNCSLNRNDVAEQKVAGQSIEQLDEKDFPVCIREHGTIMAPFIIDVTVKHPYVEISPETHGHLKPTNMRMLPYSAAATPFQWMLKTEEDFEQKVNLFDLDFDWEREPELPWQGKIRGGYWVQEYRNQKAMLNCFFQHLKEEESLVFFYAKQVPFVESSDRVIIGVGRVLTVYDCEKYDGSNTRFAAAYWEHDIVHSIRPDESDGFLLPYHEVLEYQKSHPDFDPATITVVAPSEKRYEFSYGTEHVTNDSAIQVLLRCRDALEKIDEIGIGKPHTKQLKWIDTQIARMQKLRGIYPGMGAALNAYGIPRGHFVAAHIISNTKKNEDAWDVLFDVIQGNCSRIPKEISALITESPKKLFIKWLNQKNQDRLNFLMLLSRFELSVDQAEILWSAETRRDNGIDREDKEYLDNPYLFYEDMRHTIFPISIETIDLGMYIKEKSVYPNDFVLEDELDWCRVRALIIRQLERASLSGHTLLPKEKISLDIRSMNLHPQCSITSDYLDMVEDFFEDEVDVVELEEGKYQAYQLKRYVETKLIISEKVSKRKNGKRFESSIDWLSLINKALDPFTQGTPDAQEKRARIEKAAALKELFASRFSVLIGPAGTGKTTLLNILASQPEVQNDGVLLLAPTGKARVRMSSLSKGKNTIAQTLAQFLSRYDRFDGEMQDYVFSEKRCSSYGTVILDEASMLTEEMLATTLDCLNGAKRFILVGDHRQLPPIGAGRPFVDIISFLRPDNITTVFPKVTRCYAELTIKRRQGGQNRDDIQLAEWFSGEELNPAADQIINDVINKKNSQYVRFINWKNEKDFENIFADVLVEELGMSSIADVETFNTSLGAVQGKYFNGRDDIKRLEDWQILSPVRERIFGVNSVNRFIHQTFRSETLKWSRDKSKLPKPLGPQEIVYGDKVINNRNQSRKDVYPDTGLGYVANGEIGVSLGFQTRYMHFRPDFHEIEYSTQPGYKYKYYPREFGEESDSLVELAYALTVHKSQGSEFGKVFLIIPNPCVLLSREMLYTALTRQTEKVIIFYQGDSFSLKELASSSRSDIVKRITNLFDSTLLVKTDNDYYSKNLIHQASDGTMLRSKSELLIYQSLISKGIEVEYEKELVLDGVRKLPDFTIEDPDTGEVYYWEHLGLLSDPDYKARWEEKKKWYIAHGILPLEDGGGNAGVLITTQDEETEIEDGHFTGSLSIPQVDKIIKQCFDV